MEELVKEIDLAILKKYEEHSKCVNQEEQAEKLFRDLRWSEPELAIYVIKKMKQFSSEKVTKMLEERQERGMEDKILEKVDETIIFICEKITNDKIALEQHADTIKALASLVEARAKCYY